MSTTKRAAGQRQRTVGLFVKSPSAIATGNNATWLCTCGHLLLGRTGLIKRQSPRFTIECPQCARTYVVVPKDRNYGRVKEVREL
jgi:hypothetical protein